MIKDSLELIQELAALGIRQISSPRDEKIFCPTKKWLDEFGVWFARRVPKWKKESFDCDDFAIRAIDRATDALNANQALGDCGHSFCYAEVSISMEAEWFGKPGPILNHSLNLVRCTNEWRVFEPQYGKNLSLRDSLDNGVISIVYECWL